MQISIVIYELYLKMYGKEKLQKILSITGQEVEIIDENSIIVTSGVKYLSKTQNQTEDKGGHMNDTELLKILEILKELSERVDYLYEKMQEMCESNIRMAEQYLKVLNYQKGN